MKVQKRISCGRNDVSQKCFIQFSWLANYTQNMHIFNRSLQKDVQHAGFLLIFPTSLSVSSNDMLYNNIERMNNYIRLHSILHVEDGNAIK